MKYATAAGASRSDVDDVKDKEQRMSVGERKAFRQQAAALDDSWPDRDGSESLLSGADFGPDIPDVLDALPFYVLLIDADHYILMANKAVQAHLGMEPKDIVGRYCPKAVHGLDEPFHACPLEEAVETGQAVEREVFDPESGHWVKSAIYPTRRLTADGKRVFFHMISDISEHRQAEEQLRTSRGQLRSLSAHLESVREQERKSVAREIHDELGQTLTALKIDLSWLKKRLPREQESLLERASSMNELLDTAIQTVKRVIAELRPEVLDKLGIIAAMEWQAAEFEKRTGIRCEFSSDPKDFVVDQDRSTALFRIFQEALTNVARHAQATKVKADLKQEAGRILLRTWDNGRGIGDKQISDAKAFGLVGMMERARYWGGDVSVSGTRGKGTLVAASIPLAHEEEHSG